MSAFKVLRDVSSNFENELGKLSTELFSAKIEESFEDVVTKKMRDVTLFNSKFKLLQAKMLTATSQVTEVNKDEQTTISNYTDTAAWKVIERQVVKTLSQSHHVKNLITPTNRELDPELIERKEKIIDQLHKYRQAESELRHLETVLQEKVDQLWLTRQTWDETVSQLRDSQKVPQDEEYVSEPLHMKLQVLVSKTQLMRWMLAQLATRGVRDGVRRLRVLARVRRGDSLED